MDGNRTVYEPKQETRVPYQLANVTSEGNSLCAGSGIYGAVPWSLVPSLLCFFDPIHWALTAALLTEVFPRSSQL